MAKIPHSDAWKNLKDSTDPAAQLRKVLEDAVSAISKTVGNQGNMVSMQLADIAKDLASNNGDAQTIQVLLLTAQNLCHGPIMVSLYVTHLMAFLPRLQQSVQFDIPVTK